jgi:4-diphosphocytidyl-2-C-methyl-D-erythritol kinase
VWRAAELLWRADKRRGRPSGVTITIAKRIPMQAGLGGGSSDAVAALRGLPRVWDTRLSADGVQAIARQLGADVAYFLEGGTALGVGRGDHLYALADRRAVFVVLVVPAFGVSTRDAYGWWDATHPGKGLAPATTSLTGEDLSNDLAPAVVAHHPEIGKIVKKLSALGAIQASMSGSGSAVFGLFPQEDAALDAAAAVVVPGRVVTVTRTVGRRDYGRLTSVE